MEGTAYFFSRYILPNITSIWPTIKIVKNSWNCLKIFMKIRFFMQLNGFNSFSKTISPTKFHLPKHRFFYKFLAIVVGRQLWFNWSQLWGFCCVGIKTWGDMGKLITMVFVVLLFLKIRDQIYVLSKLKLKTKKIQFCGFQQTFCIN